MSEIQPLPRARWVLIVSLFLLPAIVAGSTTAGLPAQPAVPATDGDLLFVLDASGSMWGQIGGQNKIVIARDVFRELAEALPDETQAGLIAYGHRREGDCDDIETLVPVGLLDREALRAAVDQLNPKGKTPLAASTELALDVVRERNRPTTVVLLTDGLETCDADPCALVRQARTDGLPFLMHVIGFDVAKEDASQLECTAQAGGGLFLTAADATDLSSAFDAAVRTSATATNAAIEVGATRNGSLHDVSIRVSPIGDREADLVLEPVSSRSYTDPATNPRRVPLLAGRYAVQVRAVGIDGDVERSFEIDLAEGETIRRDFDFSTGQLRVSATDNGELQDTSVRIYLSGTTEQVAIGRTYEDSKTNPRSFELTAGTYDASIRAVGLEGYSDVRLEGLEVTAARPVERSHNYASGDVSITVRRGADLVDATVRVRSDRGEIARARTYSAERTNPATWSMAPGRYRVTVDEVRGNGMAEFEIDVRSGETVEQEVELP